MYQVARLATSGHRVASTAPKLFKAFPQGTAEEQARFELLSKAYVDARYKPSFTITAAELEYLATPVQYLQ